ncbi:uncharacterized protein LOC135489680 isoform X2 [Lineus longissimus]|uniref:uncharacterized protein LOC135489680 isoform X2 n=1 Tax=Lineus longissimus TaxID=88925 RepID=UPI002B4D6FCC
MYHSFHANNYLELKVFFDLTVIETRRQTGAMSKFILWLLCLLMLESAFSGTLVESTQDVAVVVAATPSHYYTPVLPADALGLRHIVLTNMKYPKSKTLYSVMALYDCTKVKIHGESSVDISTEKQINAYEIFQVIKALDLTGTQILADKPVAVFAGDSDSTWQILPVEQWGQTYVFYSTQKNVGKRYFKVLSAKGDTVCTNVMRSGATISKLGTIIAVSQITKMECTDEVLVAELRGNREVLVSETRDTGLSILSLFPATALFLDNFQLVFWTFQYAVTICIPSDTIGNVQVDGKSEATPAKIGTISGYDIFSLGTFEGKHWFSHPTVKFGLTVTFYDTNSEAREYVSHSNTMIGLQKNTLKSATDNFCQDQTTTTTSAAPTFGESGGSGGGGASVSTAITVMEADPLVKTKYLAVILGVCGGVPFLIVGCVALHAMIASRLSRGKKKRTVNPAADLSE